MALGSALGLAWSPGTPRHFAWQAWHKLTSTVVLRGRRGICVAGVALMALGGALGLAWSPVTPGTPRHFAWQAWHKLTSTVVLRGRRGTNSHPPSFCVAGVALMALGGALGLAWSPVTPGTPRHFAWQAWHKLTSTVVLRGRRGICVAGVALMALGGALGLAWSPVTPGTPRHFAWQAWHNLTSTVVLRGRRGTNSHPPSFCVAGVALMALGGALGLAWSPVTPGTPRHFAWQAWHKLTSTVVLRGRRGICVAGVVLMALGGALGLAWSPVTPGTPRHFARCCLGTSHQLCQRWRVSSADLMVKIRWKSKLQCFSSYHANWKMCACSSARSCRKFHCRLSATSLRRSALCPLCFALHLRQMLWTTTSAAQ